MTCYTCLVHVPETQITYRVAAHDLITGPTLRQIVYQKFGSNCHIYRIRTWPNNTSITQALQLAVSAQK